MNSFRFFILAAVIFFQHTVLAWDLNDVSYLMPLPYDLEDSLLLRPESDGGKGALIPRKHLERVPPLAFVEDDETLLRSIRLVGVRIDPCFPLPTPYACQKQVRMVWQPYNEVRGSLSSIDGSLHTFYVLTDSEFKTLSAELSQWKTNYKIQTQNLPLQIHPAWQEEGDSSQALADFNKIILKTSGEENLMRLTAMVLRGTGNAWIFAGFDTTSGELEIQPVPRLGSRTSQAFVNTAIPFDHFGGGGITPFPQTEDTLNNLVAISNRLNDKNSEQTILSESQAAYRIENPHNYNPENMDCASCHVTGPALQWVLANKPQLNIEKLFSRDIYRNAKYNLENLSPELWNTRIIRAFGYFGQQMAISQRVINESAEVADLMNTNYPEKK